MAQAALKQEVFTRHDDDDEGDQICENAFAKGAELSGGPMMPVGLQLVVAQTRMFSGMTAGSHKVLGTMIATNQAVLGNAVQIQRTALRSVPFWGKFV